MVWSMGRLQIVVQVPLEKAHPVRANELQRTKMDALS